MTSVSLPASLIPRLRQHPEYPLLQYGRSNDHDTVSLTLPDWDGHIPELNYWAAPAQAPAELDVRNLRICGVTAPQSSPGPMPSMVGLSDVRMSGSSQYTDTGMQHVLQTLRQQGVKPSDVYFMDLRLEPHAIVDDLPVSWNVKGGEDDQFEGFLVARTRDLAEAARPHADLKAIETEADVAQANGAHYLRYRVTDHCAPSRDNIDKFVSDFSTLRSQHPHAWFHAHCAEGVGRTTTFMSMADMMVNARQVSFEDILTRQALIGGLDLLHPAPGSSDYTQAMGRLDVLRNFYQYCRTNTDNYKTPYSTWLK